MIWRRRSWACWRRPCTSTPRGTTGTAPPKSTPPSRPALRARRIRPTPFLSRQPGPAPRGGNHVRADDPSGDRVVTGQGLLVSRHARHVPLGLRPQRLRGLDRTVLQFGMGGRRRLALSLADPGRPLVSGSRLRRRHPLAPGGRATAHAGRDEAWAVVGTPAGSPARLPSRWCAPIRRRGTWPLTCRERCAASRS